MLLRAPLSSLNVSLLSPTATLLNASGAVLSVEQQPPAAQPESQCGEGRGGPIVGGCLRSFRSLAPGEGIYGFGMQSFSVNHTGSTVWVQTDANPDPCGRDHAPTPFFLSSLGYGVVLNTHAYSYFDVGFAIPARSQSEWGTNLMHTSDPILDVFLLAGPTLPAVMGQFTQLYGRTALPPKWASGLWYHPKVGYNQSQVEGIVDEFAVNNVSLVAVTLEPTWQTHAYSCTYVVNEGLFPEFSAFVARLASNGTYVTLWQHAYVYNASQGLASPLWEPIMGGGLASSWITWGGATPDWTLPATREAVWGYMNETFLSGAGVAGFKLVSRL